MACRDILSMTRKELINTKITESLFTKNLIRVEFYNLISNKEQKKNYLHCKNPTLEMSWWQQCPSFLTDPADPGNSSSFLSLSSCRVWWASDSWDLPFFLHLHIASRSLPYEFVSSAADHWASWHLISRVHFRTRRELANKAFPLHAIFQASLLDGI